jgi:hypothetical protein
MTDREWVKNYFNVLITVAEIRLTPLERGVPFEAKFEVDKMILHFASDGNLGGAALSQYSMANLISNSSNSKLSGIFFILNL